MIALWCGSAMAAHVAVLVLNPEELAADKVGGILASIGGAFSDLPAIVNQEVAAGVQEKLRSKKIDNYVLVEVKPMTWKTYTPTYTLAGAELMAIDPIEGTYNAVVLEVPDPIRLAKREKGAAMIVVARMLGVRVKKITMETLAEEVATGLVAENVLPAVTYTWW